MHESISAAMFVAGVSTLTTDLCRSRRWMLYTAQYPILEISFTDPERTPLRLRMNWSDWNALPPSVEFLSADGAQEAAPPSTPGGQFNPNAHPSTGRPFVCMAGAREYHSHPSHVGDAWDRYRSRSGYDFGGIITQLWNAWRLARP